jgi:hypothetical protein
VAGWTFLFFKIFLWSSESRSGSEKLITIKYYLRYFNLSYRSSWRWSCCTVAGWTCEAVAVTRKPSNRSSPIWESAGRAASPKRTPLNPAGLPRVHAQTIYYQENLAFCFQLCTVAHFLGYLPLTWFSCFLVFFLYRQNRFSGYCVLSVEK